MHLRIHRTNHVLRVIELRSFALVSKSKSNALSMQLMNGSDCKHDKKNKPCIRSWLWIMMKFLGSFIFHHRWCFTLLSDINICKLWIRLGSKFFSNELLLVVTIYHIWFVCFTHGNSSNSRILVLGINQTVYRFDRWTNILIILIWVISTSKAR